MFRESLVEWITIRDLPFSEVNAPSFRRMVCALNPDAKVPSADTVRRDIDKRLYDEKGRIRVMLQDAPGRLSFAIDAWTSPTMQAFLGITVHWIDADWRMHSLLLDMATLTGRHTGENLCTTFRAVCHDFGVMTKVLAITTDSASNNDTFLTHLEAACLHQGISFDRNSMHVRCIAHVINLAVQDFLRTLNSCATGREDTCDEQYSAGAGPAGFITRLRKLVVKVRDSTQRREQLARQCEVAGIRPKELVVDVRTRWNSTYDMIERALELCQPLDHTAMLNPDLLEDKLAPEEWQLLRGTSASSSWCSRRLPSPCAQQAIPPSPLRCRCTTT